MRIFRHQLLRKKLCCICRLNVNYILASLLDTISRARVEKIMEAAFSDQTIAICKSLFLQNISKEKYWLTGCYCQGGNYVHTYLYYSFLKQRAFILKPTQFAFFFSLNSLTPREFNSYGSRRGNDAVMARGTFANIRLVNKFIDKQGPQTIHFPSGEIVSTHAALNCGSLPTEWISAGFPSYQLR